MKQEKIYLCERCNTLYLKEHFVCCQEKKSYKQRCGYFSDEYQDVLLTINHYICPRCKKEVTYTCKEMRR